MANDGKDTLGYAFHIGSTIFSWSSQNQQTVDLSTCEAEYIAATECTCQAMSLAYILRKLNLANKDLVLFSWTTYLLFNSRKIQSHNRSKHINIKFHFIWEHVNDKMVEMVHCRTEENLANIFTKPLKLDVFQKMKEKLEVQSRGVLQVSISPEAY